MEELAKRYWSAMLGVVNAWAHYNTAKKLYISATSPETKHKVSHVVSRYFGGDPEKIVDYKFALMVPLEYELANFKKVCDEAGIKQPYTTAQNGDLNWLFNNLEDGDDYEKIRNKIYRRLKRLAAPQPIEDLV